MRVNARSPGGDALAVKERDAMIRKLSSGGYRLAVQYFKSR